MIKYALGCAEGHAFESWFPDSAAYEKQRKRGFVACPECGSTRVDKAIMAPAVVGGDRAAGEPVPRSSSTIGAGRRASFCSACAGKSRPTPTTSARNSRKWREPSISAKSPSARFAAARASRKRRSLLEDGVGVLPLPMLEDELN